MLIFVSMVIIGDLTSEIRAIIDKQPAHISVAFKDLQSGETLLIDENRIMHAASTMKVPVMMTLFHKAELGELDLQQTVRVRNQFTSIVDGSTFTLDDDPDDPMFEKLGHDVPLVELIGPMIIYSSNLATNLLIEIADPKEIMALMTEIGCTDIKVRRGVFDIKAYELHLNNECHAADMMRVMEACARSTRFSEGSKQAMLRILAQQHYRDMIPAGIPEDAGVVIANKTGSISTVQHDAAYIELPDGSAYVLVIFTSDFGSNRELAIQAARQISSRIYRHMVRQ
ncbi:MAG: serine hydrolase [Acidobacteria bacterium]|nr:serine hydrolase [Acidobacteriota bacterium]